MAPKRNAPTTAPDTITFTGCEWKRTDGDEYRDIYALAGWSLDVSHYDDEEGPHDWGATLEKDVGLGGADGHEAWFEASVDHYATRADALLALERLIGAAAGRVTP